MLKKRPLLSNRKVTNTKGKEHLADSSTHASPVLHKKKTAKECQQEVEEHRRKQALKAQKYNEQNLEIYVNSSSETDEIGDVKSYLMQVRKKNQLLKNEVRLLISSNESLMRRLSESVFIMENNKYGMKGEDFLIMK